MTRPLPLLATGARQAGRREGLCCVCGQRMHYGQRIARLVLAGKLAHVCCVARTDTGR